MRMKTRRSLVMVALASTLSACATTGAGRQDRPAMAIRRGSTWVTYSFDLPRIIGPTVELRLQDGVLRGFMASRAMDVAMRPGDATGSGPSGPVNLTITDRDGKVEVHGLWNGAPAHLSLAPTSLRASLVVRPGRPGGQEVSCGYQLDRLEASGALVGWSACGGMPQETRLEVDPRLRQRLARHELAVFLIAALAAPPFSPHERI
jgi:hypothetical protein